ESFRYDLYTKRDSACHVTAGPAQAWDEAGSHRIIADSEHDRYRRGRSLRRQRPVVSPERGNHRHLPTHQIVRKRGQSLHVVARPTEFDRHVAPFDETGLIEAPAKCVDSFLEYAGQASA